MSAACNASEHTRTLFQNLGVAESLSRPALENQIQPRAFRVLESVMLQNGVGDHLADAHRRLGRDGEAFHQRLKRTALALVLERPVRRATEPEGWMGIVLSVAHE